MLFRNFTPFPPLHFESRDENQNDFGVLVLRGTFQIVNGQRLTLVQDQAPIIFYDEYFAGPQQSSLKYEGHLSPFKPSTDIVLTADAYSPTGGAERQWNVGIQFGDVWKQLTVTGPRMWERGVGGFRLSNVEPVMKLPIRYESSFGGSFHDENNERVAWPENPVGCGFVSPRNRAAVPAPQIFASEVDAATLTYGKPVPTAGFGFVAPHWAPRCDKVGTYDERWKRTRFPDLPSDFQYTFYNSASAGLTLTDFATGFEEVELQNLTAERRTVFGLPGLELGTIMRFESGEILPGPVKLDTVHIDATQMLVHLTWRSVFPVSVPMRVLEVRARDAYATPVRG